MIFVRYSFLPHFGILADLKWGLKGYVEGGGQDNVQFWAQTKGWLIALL